MRILILMFLSLISTGIFGQFKISQVEGEVTDTEGVAVINQATAWNELKILPQLEFRAIYDSQDIILVGNTLTLENGGTVDLAPYLDNTDNQQITAFSLAGNVLTLTLEDGGTQTVNLSGLDDAGTDDQNLTLVGNTLILEDGGTVDLAPYLDNTDSQQITAFSLAGNVLTLTLEDGGTQTVDLSGLDDAGTDDQNLTLVGNTLTLEDGGSVDLSVTGTSGSIFFASSDGFLTENNSNLFWNNSNNRLGVGTKNPATDLEIKNQDIYVRKGIIKVESGYNGVPQSGDYIPNKIWSEYWNNSRMELWVGGSKRSNTPILKLGVLSSIDSQFAGTVSGEQASAPDQFTTLLQMNTAISNASWDYVATQDINMNGYGIRSGGFLQFKNSNSQLVGVIASPENLYGGNASSDFETYIYGSNKYFISTNGSRRFTIDGSGNVGIATISPSEKLEVAGNVKVSGKVLAQEYSSEGNIIMYLDSDQNGSNTLTVKDGAGSNKIIMSEEGQITASNFVATNTPNSKLSTNWVQLNDSAPIAGDDNSLQLYSSAGRLKWFDDNNITHTIAQTDDALIEFGDASTWGYSISELIISISGNTTISVSSAPVGVKRTVKNTTGSSVTFQNTLMLCAEPSSGDALGAVTIPPYGTVTYVKKTTGNYWIKL